MGGHVSGRRPYMSMELLWNVEHKDYIIDYNAEIIFNPTYPITSEMRITVDYQYSERNYTRFVGYAAAEYDSETKIWGIILQ